MNLRELTNMRYRAKHPKRQEQLHRAMVAKERLAEAWFANAYYVPSLDVHVHASVVRRNKARLVRRIDFGRNGRYA